MADYLLNLNALNVYLLITAAGFIFLLASLLLGDLFELLNHDGGSTHEMGLLDTRVISIFVTAFGGVGALGIMLGLGVVISSLLGLAGGLAFGAVVFFFARMLYEQQSSSSVSIHGLVGRVAEVIVPIHPDNVGQISCLVGEERVEKLARSRDNTTIERGKLVVIESIADEVVIVNYDEEIAGLYSSTS